MRTINTSQVATNPGVEVTTKDYFKYFSTAIYSHHENCERCDEAVVLLKLVYGKKVTDIYLQF